MVPICTRVVIQFAITGSPELIFESVLTVVFVPCGTIRFVCCPSEVYFDYPFLFSSSATNFFSCYCPGWPSRSFVTPFPVITHDLILKRQDTFGLPIHAPSYEKKFLQGLVYRSKIALVGSW